MSASFHEPAVRMNRDEYRAWAVQQGTGRYERINGVVVAMAPERVNHNLRKMQAWQALRRGVQQAGLSCDAYGDGMTVEVGDSDYEPDAVLRCGDAPLPGDAIAVPDPLVIVEVLSPSTSNTDRAWKLGEYFKLPSLRHYLIIWADQRQIAHHRRSDTGQVETRIVTAGEIALEPPGITIAIEDIYA